MPRILWVFWTIWVTISINYLLLRKNDVVK